MVRCSHAVEDAVAAEAARAVAAAAVVADKLYHLAAARQHLVHFQQLAAPEGSLLMHRAPRLPVREQLPSASSLGCGTWAWQRASREVREEREMQSRRVVRHSERRRGGRVVCCAARAASHRVAAARMTSTSPSCCNLALPQFRKTLLWQGSCEIGPVIILKNIEK